jgi:transcriptional regulator with XRE-family HTH domain
LTDAHSSALFVTTNRIHKVERTMTPQELGQQIRSQRKYLRLTQRDLAEMAEVNLRGLTDLERGRGNPTLRQLAKILDVLGLELTIGLRAAGAVH